MPDLKKYPWLRFGAAFLVIAVATLLRRAFNPVLGETVPFIFYFPSVVLCAWFGGLGAGITAIGLASVASWFYFLRPASSFILSAEGFTQLMLFLFSGLLISMLADNLHRARAAADGAKREEERNREQLTVTLSSIGDGVIATDRDGLISFMNGVAQSLTGWKEGDVSGRKLDEVFRIINEETRRPAENPVSRVFREGTVVGLANHTILISKDGTEVPIDDSAAPIRNSDGEIIGAVLVFRDDSDRRRSYEAASRLAAIVESSEDAIVAKKLDGIITNWNRGAEQIFGYTAAEIVGKPVTTLIPKELHGEETMILSKIRRGDRVGHFESTRRRKDGQLLKMSITVSPIRDRSGRIIGASKVARDVTERERSEKLIRSLLHISERLNSTQDIEELLDVLAMEAILLVNGESGFAALVCSGVVKSRRLFKESGSQVFEHTFNAGDGTAGRVLSERAAQLTNDVDADSGLAHPLYVELGVRSAISVPVMNSAGEMLAVIEIHNRRSGLFTQFDVNALRGVSHIAATALQNALAYQEVLKSKEALREDEERMRIAQQAARWGIFDYNYRTRENTWSPEIEALYGLREGEFDKTYEGWLSRVHPEDRNKAEAEMASALETASYSTDLRVVWPNGSIHWVFVRARVFLGADGKPTRMLGVHVDITDRKRAEQELERLLQREQAARARAEESSRLKDEFLATVSHELRTPLNAIIGWAALLRDDRLDSHSGRRALEIIQRNARAQAQIIGDILDVSRIITGRLRLEVSPVDPVAAIQTAIESIRPAAVAKGIRINRHVEVDTGPIMADSERLQQILWNLLSNAVKFTSRGGNIDVTLEQVDGHVQLTVADDGQGIDPAFLPYVFDRFRQADSSTTRNYGGLGLGLSIVRHLVELHGGTVSADSPGAGFGAKFYVRLPRTVRQPASREDAGSSPAVFEPEPDLEPTPDLGGLRVLVVDDEPDARLLLRTILERCRAEVLEAGSADAALQQVIEARPDVLISDVGMPGRDGYSLIEKIRTLEKGSGAWLPAVAVTAHARDEDRLRALSAGYQMHIPKPINPAEVGLVVARLAQHRTRNAGADM